MPKMSEASYKQDTKCLIAYWRVQSVEQECETVTAEPSIYLTDNQLDRFEPFMSEIVVIIITLVLVQEH